VILVEDPLRLDQIEALLALVVPGQIQDPIDVVPDDGRLGARRVHHLELLELLLDLRGGLLAHPLRLEALFDLLDLVLELVPLSPSELLLDRLHLLVEVVLLLRLLHLLLDAAPDLLLHWRISISACISSMRRSNRCFGTSISSSPCRSASLIVGRFAMIVSASLDGSSMACTLIKTSGWIFLLSFTYISNVDWTERISASISTLATCVSGISSNSTRKYGSV
jgi:hypothetical protein